MSNWHQFKSCQLTLQKFPRGDFIVPVLITFTESLDNLCNHFSWLFQDQSKSVKFQCSTSPLDVSKMEQTTSPILSKGSNATNCTNCHGTQTMIHQVWPPTLSSQKQRGWSELKKHLLTFILHNTQTCSAYDYPETIWNGKKVIWWSHLECFSHLLTEAWRSLGIHYFWQPTH